MRCRSIMTPRPPKLKRDDTIGVAVEMLLLHRTLALPVVEDDDRYLGVFAKSRLFGLLLPAIVGPEQGQGQGPWPEGGEQDQILAEMHKRLAAVSDYLVGPCSDTTVPVVGPDEPIIAALRIVFRTRNFVPVVAPATGRLLGMISTWDAINGLRMSR